MQGFERPVLWCCIVLFLVSGVSAFTVSKASVDTSGTIDPGDLVNISCVVYAASGVAFPSYDDLQFITVLDDPSWYYSISVNGVKNIRPVAGGRTLTISGFELAYRDQDEVLVKVLLRGRVPLSFARGTTRTLVTIQELDARGYAIPYSIVTVDQLIGEPTPTPTPAIGSIYVTSSPYGVDVYLDNAYKGFTPLTIDGIPNGIHTVLLRRDGYEESSRTVVVTGNAKSISVTLAPLTTSTTTATTTATATVTGTVQPTQTTPVPAGESGSLSVNTTPSGAQVYVDGVLKGVTPATIPGLSAGSHAVRLVMAGYGDLNTTITVYAGRISDYSTALPAATKTPGFAMIGAVLALLGLVVIRKIRK
jgi:PEGA domain